MATHKEHNIPSASSDQLKVNVQECRIELEEALKANNLKLFKDKLKTIYDKVFKKHEALQNKPEDILAQYEKILNESEIILTLVKKDSNAKFLEVFLQHTHIDLAVEDYHGYGILARAIHCNANKIAKTLIKKYGKDKTFINPNHIWPPLHTACNKLNIKMVKYLLKHGANSKLESLTSLKPRDSFDIQDSHPSDEIKKMSDIIEVMEAADSITGKLSTQLSEPSASASEATQFIPNKTTWKFDFKLSTTSTKSTESHQNHDDDDTTSLVGEDDATNYDSWC